MPPKKSEPKDQLRAKIASIRKAILKAETTLQHSKNLDNDIAKSKSVLLNLIRELHNMALEHPDAAEAISIKDEIKSLKYDVEFPNLHKPYLHPVQQQALAAAAEVVANWESVTPGVSLNNLPGPARILLAACTTESWSPFQIVSREMFDTSPATLTAHHINVAAALFQAMVPQYCGVNIPTQEQVERNDNKVGDLLRCIAIVACNKSKKGYNPIFVFAEAAFRNPLQFLKDATGVGFALGTLIEMAGPTAAGVVRQLPGAALTAGTHVAGNPLASFTTYQVAAPYIKGLIQQVLGERFGVNFGNGQAVDPNIRALFDRLSEYYLNEGVTDIIGFPPADRDSILNRLSQLLYQLGDRSLRSLQSTGSIVSKALRFPGELCESVRSTGSAIKKWWCEKGTQLVERYKFIPQGTEEGFFEELLHLLSDSGLDEDPHITACVVAYLKHNKTTTVIHEAVDYHTAQDTLINGPFFSAGDLSESMEADVDPDSQPNEMDVHGDKDGSGLPADAGQILAEPDMSSSDGSQLANFKTDQQRGILQANSLQQAARTAEEEEAQRLAASAQASAAPPSRAFARGGRSRSRKRSVSKRTRRKGVAKKQKSKKNKRQSRRKVHRASSRKGRK